MKTLKDYEINTQMVEITIEKGTIVQVILLPKEKAIERYSNSIVIEYYEYKENDITYVTLKGE